MFALTPAVRNIIIATTAVFFLQMTMPGGAIEYWLGFIATRVLVRPWTLVTYMLVHGGFGHIFFNLLGLFFFGPRVEERIGTGRFYALYVVAGITGALAGFFFPGGLLVGASGAIFGVMMAFAYFWPTQPIHIWGVIPVPAALLILIYALYSIFGLRGGGSTAHYAHLGGFAGGFLYLKWMERGKVQWKKKVTATPAKIERDVSRYRQVDRSGMHALNREELDRILDKISASGVASLTQQERIFLSNFTPKDDRPPVS